jgi:PKD repeat protein
VTTSHGCSAQSIVRELVFVAPIPTIAFSIDPATCLDPGSNTLNYIGSASSKDQFIWNITGLDPAEVIQSPGTTSGPLIFDLINKPSANISLQVITQFGCKSEDKTLTVKRKPVFSFESDAKVGCIPLLIRFKAKSGDPVDPVDYLWNFGDGGTAAGKEVSHQYIIPDRSWDLSVNAVSKMTGCTASRKEKDYINVFPSPKAGFLFSPKNVYNDQPKVEFLDQSSDAVRFEWNFGDDTFSTQQSPSHQYDKIGVKKILQTVYNQFNCSDTTSLELTVELRKIFTPNALSPNAINPVDREFLPYSNGVRQEGYHLRILSRWDDLVFECKNEIKGWNGKLVNGNWAQAGNYIWILDFTDFLGEVHRQMGTVTLIY